MAHVRGLRCRECGKEYEVAPIYTCEWCFGPLEVAYDYDAITADISREQVAAGPLNIWRYAELLPVDEPGDANPAVGFTPLVRADRLASELGLGELWIKDDTRNPTNSFKDRVTAVAPGQGARVRPEDRGLRVHRQPGQRGRGRLGPARHPELRLHPGQPRGGQDRHHRGLRRQRGRGRRHLRRRQPPVRRARQRAAVGVLQRERATVLRRGLEDARLRDRRAARLAGTRPRGGPRRQRVAADQGAQGVRGAAPGRPAR